MQLVKLHNIASAITLQRAHEKQGRLLSPGDLDAITNACIVHNSEKIIWVGKTNELPDCYRSLTSHQCHDCTGYIVTPEIVDCHTHLVFGGNRSQEYTMRLNGADYEAIARQGGGILSTMQATNSLSQDQLFALAQKRCERLHSYGVGTIEIKSGYGLNLAKEYELSHLIHQLKQSLAPRIQIHNTLLAAHAIPREFASSTEYLQQVALPLLERLSGEGIIDSVDIFCERGYFSRTDGDLLFSRARELGIARRCHVDEFSDQQGALLACQHQALSCDHLLYTNPDGIQALAQSHTVATLLPGTGFFLGKGQAQARKFLDAGCRVAIGSDYNPGSCHFDNLVQIATMAAPHYSMNLAELWAAITLNGAAALGLSRQGAIAPGLAARFSFFRAPSIDDITYCWGKNFASPPAQPGQPRAERSLS